MVAEVNLIYPAHQGPPSVRYEGPEGRVFISNSRHGSRNNVALSWYGLKKPEKNDSIFVLEPMCVHPRDYDINYLNKFKHVFAWTKKAFAGSKVAPKVIETNHPNIIGKQNPENFISKWKPWGKRKNEIVVIANNKSGRHPSQIYQLRTHLADHTHGNITKYHTRWYGQSCPKKPYKAGLAKDKMDILRDVKFTICSENCYDPKYSHNYFTEKMMHAWMGGAVPLYMGCHNIDDYFPKSAYIDLRPHVIKKGPKLEINYQAIRNILNDFNEEKFQTMMEEVKKLMRREDGLFHVCSWDRVSRLMLNKFSRK